MTNIASIYRTELKYFENAHLKNYFIKNFVVSFNIYANTTGCSKF